MSRFTALVIDDEEMVLGAMARLLRADDIEVVTATSGESALEMLSSSVSPIHVLICDFDLPGIDGAEVLRRARTHWPRIPRILLTGKADLPSVARIVNDSDISRLLLKPWDPSLIGEQIAQVVDSKPIHDRGEEASASEVAELERALHAAIEGDQLRLFYQPQVGIASGQVVAVEALVRWQHPDRGLLLPIDFIPQVEQSGIIRKLSQWVLGASMRQSVAWGAAGIQLPIWLNLSTVDLHDASLPVLVQELLTSTGADPFGVRVEVTEGALMIDPQRASHVLSRLRRLGLQVAIDDFGTGYSSLARLANLPVDVLKLDKLFIDSLAHSPGGDALVRSTIELGHRLGMIVVAEGVADTETFDRLQELECDLAQGFLFSEPVPHAELIDWLRHWRSSVTPRRRPGKGHSLARAPISLLRPVP